MKVDANVIVDKLASRIAFLEKESIILETERDMLASELEKLKKKDKKSAP